MIICVLYVHATNCFMYFIIGYNIILKYTQIRTQKVNLFIYYNIIKSGLPITIKFVHLLVHILSTYLNILNVLLNAVINNIVRTEIEQQNNVQIWCACVQLLYLSLHEHLRHDILYYYSIYKQIIL